jgi:hypothetical protein
MKYPTSQQIVNNLEFLGYKMEDRTNEDGGEGFDMLLGIHKDKSNIFIIVTEKTIVINSRYSIGKLKKNNTEKLLKTLNDINKKVVQTKWSYEESKKKESVLEIETFLPKYDKRDFIKLMNIFERDISLFLSKIVALS